MKLLFLSSAITEEWTHLDGLFAVLAVLYTCVFLSVIVDLFFGVRRARQLKIMRTSYGYRRTITKLTGYFGLMIMFSIADVVASVVFKMPYFSVVGAIGIILVEAKSVFENLKQQEKNIAEVQRLLLKFFENKEEIQTLIAFLNAQTQETFRNRASCKTEATSGDEAGLATRASLRNEVSAENQASSATRASSENQASSTTPKNEQKPGNVQNHANAETHTNAKTQEETQ
ncbi:phage holin family protein [Anaerorudis cellulosivorans]|uniref:phage holin family protein n=1 Tax=Anaerorudis cellulosivorans TaxID=3397862 RepID=UPI00221F3654|nr:phage holin family protein [Seramator thermalis]MCW1735978.1 phage holin family protein [Seramator thermalis]